MGRFSELRRKAKKKKTEIEEKEEKKEKGEQETSKKEVKSPPTEIKTSGKIELPPSGLAEDILQLVESGEPVTVPEEPPEILEEPIHFEEALIQMVVFSIGEEVYGIDIYNVREIINPVEIIRVPRSSKSLIGVINLRGNVIPVFDFRIMFNIPSDEKTTYEKFIVVEVTEHLVAFMVDRIFSVSKVPIEEIEPAPPQLRLGIDSEFISGLAKIDGKVVAIIEVDKLVKSIKTKGGKTYE